MKPKTIELTPVKDSPSYFDHIERAIKILLKREIYEPIMREFSANKKLLNAKQTLADAIKSGRIQYYRATFSGRFSAEISKELKALGARWDGHTGTWKLSQTSLTPEIQIAIKASEYNFQRKIETVDKKLAAILPGEIADKLKVEKLFDATLWKIERNFQKTISKITVAPKLTKEQRARIAAEWSGNLKLYIKNWTEEETKRLRETMQSQVFAGNRYEGAIAKIQKSYGVTENKAKFLARQETNLLMSKFKEVRYSSAGITKYRWKCVAGTAKHPVRQAHKTLDGKIFTWNNPIELDKNGSPKPGGAHKPGENKNPGEDYNCRCYAKPIVEFGNKGEA